MDQQWEFVNEEADFRLEDVDGLHDLYFPLVNEAGMMSVVTPLLHGDAKTGQNTFLLPPVSIADLHLTRTARNIWLRFADGQLWSATGNSAAQRAGVFGEEKVTLEAGLLWHKVTRFNPRLGISAAVVNVVPATSDTVELMQVTLTNRGETPLSFAVIGAIPIYGRSADNLRDHRHVTSLLHRIRTVKHGVLVKPTLSFDERGHQPNTVSYLVLGAEEDGAAPEAFYPCLEDFVGERGTLDAPEALLAAPGVPAGYALDGYEALGGIRFHPITLNPGESRSYVFVLAIIEHETAETLMARYGDAAKFAAALEATRAFWREKLSTFALHTGEARFDHWMRWVSVQPVLRRLFGNSFLPYHDYGRGGRGWRDLWQDQLALLFTEPEGVGEALWHNFAGVRMDGSNATIIGRAPGEFKADRNNIPRVWMDHGVWPLLTTEQYIHATGDLEFLLREQVYFKDAFTHRATRVDSAWDPSSQGTQQRTRAGEVYRGTVLEHLLVQHLTAFFNVGPHNMIRLEDADWNDGLDMAAERGESVAFTAFYAGNLRTLAGLVRALMAHGVKKAALALELMPLLDTLSAPVSYTSVAEKQARLQAYFDSVQGLLSGAKKEIPLDALAHDLEVKAEWLEQVLRKQEWLTNAEGYSWFNGYYDNDGQRVEGDHPLGVRMTLTGQVFPLLCGVATDEQVAKVVAAVNRYLYEPTMGGPRLNTDFKEVLLNLGRCFGFAYGHKENGAMFTHMAVMYGNALYRRGLAQEGYRILDGIYRHVQDFARAHMYPGLPEYVTPRGKGGYPYLTGSGSWYVLTYLTEVFGVQGRWGDLVLRPRLVAEQFDAQGTAWIETRFAGRRLRVVYHNPARLDAGAYRVTTLTLDGQALPCTPDAQVVIPRDVLLALDAEVLHQLEVGLVALPTAGGAA